jgi:hypothetical protein
MSDFSHSLGAAANRRWRLQFRCRGSRRESAVAQLFSLGVMFNRPTIIVVAILVAGVVFFLLSRSDSYLVMKRNGSGVGIMTPRPVLVSQIPSVFDQLKANHKDASWAAFTFCPVGEPATDQNSVNIQYSVEGGKIGFDWVLLAPRNIADKDKIVAFMKDKHYTVLEREGNGVRYLRVEDGDLVQLGKQVAEFYHLQADDQMGIFVDGFEWKP